jgi:hypothetical protein
MKIDITIETQYRTSLIIFLETLKLKGVIDNFEISKSDNLTERNKISVLEDKLEW